MRPLLTLWLLLFAVRTPPVAAQGGSSLRERILQVEDRRAPSEADLSLLQRSLHHADGAVVLQTIRALGRLERPDVAAYLIPLLADSSGRIRARTAEALAQAAQGFRKDSSVAHRGAAWPAIIDALSARVPLERDPEALGSLALSLGRLPYLTVAEIHGARENLLALLEAATPDPDATRNAVRGLEAIVRATARRAPVGSALALRLEALTAMADERSRRYALGGLLAGQAGGPRAIVPLLGSADGQTRRLAVTALARLPAGAEREKLVGQALADPSPMVRIEALRVAARITGAAACPALRDAGTDSALVVTLAAIDLLAACTGDTAVVGLLAAAALPRGGSSWHTSAHALVSLARVAPERARSMLAEPSGISPWQSRMYAARAAAAAGDTLVLLRYAADPTPNVREAAIAGLATLGGHTFDSVYRAGLTASDYQLLLGAATALAGSTARGPAVAALLSSLDRVTRERRETSRDARVALLTRVHELGTAPSAPRVLPYLRDFDPVVAESAAVILGEWTGRPHRAAPVRLPIAAVSLAEVEALRGKRFHFTLATGGEFEVELYTDEAPVTVARLARLVRRKYFDGLTWHRDVPNFVLQGGSPGANEYTGDGPFMRDELSSRSHERGTLGVSTRGRDTGDGQLFVNLVDNPRLDFEYTVWGRVVSGWDVVPTIREGALIRRVEIRPR